MDRRLWTLLAGLACALVAVPALATPQSDFDAVYGDWRPDLVITPCRWSQAQLQNAYNVANSNPDFQYETRFSDDVQKEIRRWKSGGCAGVVPLPARQKSPLFGARVVTVKGRGGVGREVVTIRNGSKRTLSFRKATLRNLRSGRANRSAFPAGFRLGKGRTVVVRAGCAKGKRRASFKARTVWLCRRKPLFRDKGDLARLADSKGIVVSQRGFGTQKRRPVF